MQLSSLISKKLQKAVIRRQGRLLLSFIFAIGMANESLAEAQKKKPAPAAVAPSSTTKKSLETSKRVKYSDKTQVDFDAANIDGTVKNPFGSIVQSRDQGFDKGFIRLRTHWHDQMVMSLSGLSGN